MLHSSVEKILKKQLGFCLVFAGTHDVEALEKLRYDLLDNTAWPVIMEWFDEDENK